MRIILLILMVFFSCKAWAQENTQSLTPPISKQGEEFKSIAKKSWQHTDAEYLHPDYELSTFEKDRSEQTKKDGRKLSPAEILARKQRAQTAAIIVLSVIVLILFLYWLNNRTDGSLFAWFRRKDQFAENNLDDPEMLVDATSAPKRTLEELSNVVDPEKGLHDLLIQALLRAAEQNNISLRRSLTTRDVLRQVPVNWPNRDVLQALVNRSELVFFGGRAIDQEGYQQALSLAQPLFSNRGGR